MPTDDYTPVSGGGLRLKGVNGSKITKHKKKRPRNPEAKQHSPSAHAAAEPSETQEHIPNEEKALTNNSQAAENEPKNRELSEDRSQPRGKTEAELRHEERRRRRVSSLTLPLYIIRRC